MRFLVILFMFLVLFAIGFAVSLLGAQFVVWGLSIMHVNSGIWGPYWILAGMSMVISTSVAISANRK